jgi:hypothetical protein
MDMSSQYLPAAPPPVAVQRQSWSGWKVVALVLAGVLALGTGVGTAVIVGSRSSVDHLRDRVAALSGALGDTKNRLDSEKDARETVNTLLASAEGQVDRCLEAVRGRSLAARRYATAARQYAGAFTAFEFEQARNPYNQATAIWNRSRSDLRACAS